MGKPIVTVKHSVALNTGPLLLVPGVHRPFMKFMGKAYPKFASYDKADNGYSAFHDEHGFVGCFGGMTLQSIRKNPFYLGEKDDFIKALLAGLHIDGHTHHSSVCSVDNYGTLQLWNRLGLGAKIDNAGKARSAERDSTGLMTLTRLMLAARRDYPQVRADAAAYWERVGAEARVQALPVARDLPGFLSAHRASVTLL